MKKSELKRLGAEGVLIVFSVLFALLIGQLVESNKVKRQKAQAIDHIYLELSNNQLILKRWVQKHRKIAENLNRMVANKRDSLRLMLMENGQLDYGIITNQEALIDALLADTAWEAAKSTRIIAEFDFETVQAFTRIYNLQTIIVQRSVQKFSDIYFDRASQDPENLQTTLVQLQLVMGEIVGQEQTLLYLLDQLMAASTQKKH